MEKTRYVARRKNTMDDKAPIHLEQYITGPCHTRLLVEAYGNVNAKTVILLHHEYLQTKQTWNALMPLLARQGIFCIAYDELYHGYTQVPTQVPISIELCAHAVHAILRYFQLENIPIIHLGWAFGTVIIQRYIHLYGSASVRALVCEAGFFNGPAHYLQCANQHAVNALRIIHDPNYPIGTRIRSLSAFIDRMQYSPPALGAYLDLFHQSFISFEQLVLHLSPFDPLSPLADKKSLSLSSNVHAHSIPTLLLWGEKDAIVDIAYGQECATGLQGKWVSFPQCGHSPHREVLAQFHQVLTAFIANLPPITA